MGRSFFLGLPAIHELQILKVGGVEAAFPLTILVAVGVVGIPLFPQTVYKSPITLVIVEFHVCSPQLTH